MNRTARLTLLSIAALAALLAVVWAMPFGAAPSAQAVEGPSITVNKVCTPEATVGGFVRYNFTITNNGSVPVDIDSVIDDHLGDITSQFSTTHLDPTQSTGIAIYYPTVLESDPRPLINTVDVSGHAGATPVSAQDTCRVDVPHLSITKRATFNDGTTTFTFVITNDGSVLLRRFLVTDTLLGDITLSFPLDIAVGESVTVEITVPRIECNNEVTATYQSVPRASLVTNTARCGEGGGPDFTVAKECSPKTGTVGDPINIKVTVTNIGTTPLTNVTVTDDPPVTLTLISGDDVNGILDPGEAWVYTGSYNPGTAGSFTDQATATATAPDGTVIVRVSNEETCQRESPPDGSRLTPTNTDCQDFRDGTATDLTAAAYGVRQKKINEVNPGVFFYYTPVTIASTAGIADQVKIEQSRTALAQFSIKFLRVWDPKAPPNDCSQLFTVAACVGLKECTFEVGQTGSFIVQVQYDSQSIKGTNVCPDAFSGLNLPTSTHTFSTKVAGALTTSDSLQVAPKAGSTC